MRNEDLKTRLVQVDFSTIQERVINWRRLRAEYRDRNPKKTKAARKTAVKKQVSILDAVKGMSPEQAAALLKELSGG